MSQPPPSTLTSAYIQLEWEIMITLTTISCPNITQQNACILKTNTLKFLSINILSK
jgi:hypothetical protein